MYIITGETEDNRIYSYGLLEEHEDIDSVYATIDSETDNMIAYYFEHDEPLDLMDEIVIITGTYKYQSKLN